MYPEYLILLGAVLGVAGGAAASVVGQSQWWLRMAAAFRYEWVTRPKRVAQVRMTTWQTRTLAMAPRRHASPPAADPERHGRHRAGDRAGSVRPAPAKGGTAWVS